MRLWRITDEVFMARVARWHRTRRYWGLAMVLGGLFFLVFILWSQARMMTLTEEMLHFSATTTSPAGVDENVNMAEKAGFLWGLVIGRIHAMGLFSGGGLLGIGIGVALGSDRKNRMLLELWEHQRPGARPAAEK
ncbi:MAG: hypothetical protein IT443_12685 [Phycisphaeraceae bacterium]|nr:hypothetical protein [Phycisphaeraceae bacterium]